jgi:hypothetical protein
MTGELSDEFGGAESFDLSSAEIAGFQAARQRGLNSLRTGLVVLLGIGAVGLAVLVPKVVYSSLGGLSHPSGLLILILLALIFLYLSIATFGLASTLIHGGRGPTIIELASDGFSLTWNDGCVMRWKWRSLKRGLKVLDLRGSGLGYSGAIRIGLFRWADLTAEALDALIRSAGSSELDMQSTTTPGQAYSAPCREIVIKRKIPDRP